MMISSLDVGNKLVVRNKGQDETSTPIRCKNSECDVPRRKSRTARSRNGVRNNISRNSHRFVHGERSLVAGRGRPV